ncbi:MAG: hypothetical protein LC803_21770 [Acidobacteria bacterium]|nr:hypothetical protein [Acidobacteriota bacterium]
MNDIPELILIGPEELPKSYSDIRRRRSERISSALNHSGWRPSMASPEEILQAVGRSLTIIGDVSFPAIKPPPNNQIADADSHDEYCRIKRVVDTDTLHVITKATLCAYEALLKDALTGGSSLTPKQWGDLHTAFRSLLHLIGQNEPVTKNWANQKIMNGSHSVLDDRGAIRRWVQGHHVFLILIQGLIISLNCFESAFNDGVLEESLSALELATVLMDGSSAALHRAGDFSPLVYDKSVRPTMMPPNVLPGMSGILARDHRHLIQLLHSQRPLYGTLEPPLRQKYDEFVAAFGCAYEAHKLVCAHFGGGERPSLLNEKAQQSGVELLEELKHSRLKGFSQADRVARA